MYHVIITGHPLLEREKLSCMGLRWRWSSGAGAAPGRTPAEGATTTAPSGARCGGVQRGVARRHDSE